MYHFMQSLSSILFLFLYFYYDIYIASLALCALSFAQLIITSLLSIEISGFEKASLGMITIFCFSTWYFHNPLYIQWKVSIIHGLIAFFIFAYHKMQKESLFSGILKNQNIIIPEKIGLKADNLLAIFMLSVSFVNYYFFTYCPEKTWVLFKSSLIFINIIFLLILSMYIGKYIQNTPESISNNA